MNNNIQHPQAGQSSSQQQMVPGGSYQRGQGEQSHYNQFNNPYQNQQQNNHYNPQYNQGQNYYGPQNGALQFAAGMGPVPGMAPQGLSQNNLLIATATPLLTLITQIRHTADHHNVPKLRLQIIEEIKKFQNKLLKAEYPTFLIHAARYCLCTAIDEAVLSRKWGTNSVWVQESLLTFFHKETWGGERFYVILENMGKDARKNIDFLEFAYFLLSLGFEGKFYGDHAAVREEIRNRTFYRIRNSREKPDKTLSRHWRDQRPIKDQRYKKNRLKRIGIMTGSALIAISVYFNVLVHNASTDVIQKLDAIATVSPITVFSQVIQRDAFVNQ